MVKFIFRSLETLSSTYLRLGGMTYADVLHIYGVSRAGYIPQLFSLRLPSPIVVSELLEKANACALICDPSFASLSAETSVSVHIAVGIDKMGEGSFPLPCLPRTYEGNDIAFVFHTSGSTSGSPKLVPCSYTWLDTAASKARQLSAPRSLERQDVTAWLGSMCHIGQSFSECRI
jgi:acyl-coenzyme A synthetase/AMP-(fatty) acid ligase